MSNISDDNNKKVKADDNIVDLELVRDTEKMTKKRKTYKSLRMVFTIGFLIFAVLFIYEVVILPIRIDNTNEKAQDLYARSSNDVEAINLEENDDNTNSKDDETDVALDPNRDKYGRLLQFKDLLRVNSDVKGYINVPNTNIDLPVLQSSNEDPEYYLTRSWTKQPLKSGSLFLNVRSSVEGDTKNLVIHGHNMKSTNNMFHHLIRYKKIDFMRENPVFRFDTLYETGEWKIMSLFITNGSSDKEPFFNYMKSDFEDDSDFLNFVYQLRIRSLYNFDDVDFNENDRIVSLSTCSYELNDYRTVIVARKIREGEGSTVDPESITHNPDPLYPQSFFDHYGGSAPDLPETFEEALKDGIISWYKPVEKNNN